MIGRDGRQVVVAYSEIELIYIAAANSLPASERWCALIDISEMTGRVFSKVFAQATRMATQKAREDAAAARALLAPIMVPRHVLVPVRSLEKLR